MADRQTVDTDPLWHAVQVEQLLRHFELDPQRGLDAGGVRHAQARHGPNALPEAPPKPLWRTFARQFKSSLIYILVVAAVLGGLTLSVALQALVLYTSPMNALFHTVPLVLALALDSLLPLLALASVVLWAEEGRKLWVRTARGSRT